MQYVNKYMDNVLKTLCVKVCEVLSISLTKWQSLYCRGLQSLDPGMRCEVHDSRQQPSLCLGSGDESPVHNLDAKTTRLLKQCEERKQQPHKDCHIMGVVGGVRKFEKVLHRSTTFRIEGLNRKAGQAVPRGQRMCILQPTNRLIVMTMYIR